MIFSIWFINNWLWTKIFYQKCWFWITSKLLHLKKITSFRILYFHHFLPKKYHYSLNENPNIVSSHLARAIPACFRSSKLRPFAFYHKSHKPPFELTYQKLTSPLLGVMFISSNHTYQIADHKIFCIIV